jgi:hypothetical protein
MGDRWKHIDGQVGLHVFAKGQWFRDISKSSIWLRIYTSLGLAHNEFSTRMKELFASVNWGEQVLVAFGQMSNFKIPTTNWDIYAQEDGTTSVEAQVGQKKVKKTNYIWVSTPYEVDGKKIEIASVRAALDEVSAVLCMHMGRNLLNSLVFEGDVRADGRAWGMPSAPIRTPTPADGPFLHSQLSSDIHETLASLRSIPQSFRCRIELALQVFEKAQRENEGFFDYWTAMEILCDGKAPKIRSQLQKCYGFRTHKDVDDKVGFAVVTKWRHDLVTISKRLIARVGDTRITHRRV